MAKIVDGVHEATPEEKYVMPEEKAVLDHLEWFKDQKLGFMLHWAPGSQFSVVESWSLTEKSPWSNVDTQSPWTTKEVNWIDDIEEYRESLVNANKTFNPIKFNPIQWAKMAKECGFRYLLATTKHHDGFCMYDTKYTDYKITAEDCPYHTNKNADVIRGLYDAFRAEGLGISTYFSKPDWACPYYWSPDFPNDRNILANYDPTEHPEIWEKFIEFTHNQLTELTTDYGKIDVLWLDGGQVSPEYNHQDIRLGEVVDKIRATTQPHLIVADRTVGGKYENILTPEQTVPEKPLNVPWESCITISPDFAYHYDGDNYLKSPKELIHLFIGIIAKGGNLALNITPQPDGEIPAKTLETLNEIGNWLKINGEGVYGTRPVAPYSHGNVCYTKKEDNVYAFIKYNRLYHTIRNVELKSEKAVRDIVLLRTGESVPFSQKGDTVLVDTKNFPLYNLKYADCLKLIF